MNIISENPSSVSTVSGKAVVIVRWPGSDGEPCYRVFVLDDGYDPLLGFSDHLHYDEALITAKELSKELNYRTADLSGKALPAPANQPS
jgi:hypothetical protein